MNNLIFHSHHWISYTIVDTTGENYESGYEYIRNIYTCDEPGYTNSFV